MRPSCPDGPLFAQLDAKALDDIRRHTRPRRYAAGAVICREGESGDSVLVLQRGFADVRVASRAERRTVDVRQLRAGDLVGEVGALTGLPRSATVVASSDADALEIEREDFDRLLADHPRLETNLTRLLGARLASGNSALRGAGRGVVAFVVAMESPALADRVLEAVRRATPRSAAIIDLRGARRRNLRANPARASTMPGHAYAVARVPQALERLDRLEIAHETVILVVGASSVASRTSSRAPTASSRSPAAARRSH